MRKAIAMTLTVLIGSLSLASASADEKALIDQSVMIDCGDGSGTGFYLDSTHIMTAKHVVTGCKTANITSNAGKKTTATNFFLDPKLDIAIIAASKTIVKPVATDSSETNLGQTVFIVGSPIDGLVLSKGKVVKSSAMSSPNRIYLEIPADHGNSGGPVFSNVGLVGMVTAKFDDGQVIAYNLKSLLQTVDLSKKAPSTPTANSEVTVVSDNSTLPALQISLILNGLAAIIIFILIIRLRRNRQIVITLD
jgi:S1-C subfamily serine protease